MLVKGGSAAVVAAAALCAAAVAVPAVPLAGRHGANQGDAALSGTEPEQIHMALGHSPSEWTISWLTADPAPSQVTYGLSPHALLQSATGEATSYTARMVPKNTFGGFVNYTSGTIHHVTLTGLDASTQYFYQLPGRDGAPLNFTTLPADGTQDGPFMVSIVGDMGQTADSQQTLQHMIADVNASVLVMAGDASYADCDGPRWDSWFNMVQPLAEAKPWMMISGNHEIEPDGTGKISAALKHRFKMPEVKPGVDNTNYFQQASNDGHDCTPSAFTGAYDYGNSFYAVTMGLSRWLFMNSYTGTNESSAQYQWLEEELKSIDRSVTPWVFATWHSPWYNSNGAHQGEFNTIAMRDAMEHLLVTYEVDAVWNGHVHAYERSHPVAFNKVQPRGKAPVYIVIGDGGNREGEAPYPHTAPPAWSAFRDGSVFGHGTLTVANATHARWEWHRNPDSEWTVTDSVWFERK